jgi:hypothetical protein
MRFGILFVVVLEEKNHTFFLFAKVCLKPERVSRVTGRHAGSDSGVIGDLTLVVSHQAELHYVAQLGDNSGIEAKLTGDPLPFLLGG